MINPQELRIGNLIHYDGAIAEVTALDLDLEDEADPLVGFRGYGGTTSENMVSHEDKYLQPIPLTPEWVAKCNFEHELFTMNLWPNNMRDGSGRYDGYTLYVKRSVGMIYKPVLIIIRHLHQLQNLYFALTGTELKINL